MHPEISNESKSMLIKVGWKKDFIEKLPKGNLKADEIREQTRQHSRSISPLEVDQGQTDDQGEADLY